MHELRFTLWEMLSLIGVVQCIYILVYIVFRVSSFKQILLPILYFGTLGTAFFLDFSQNYIGQLTLYYDLIIWSAWSLIIPLGVLLIIQVSQISKLPAWPFLFILALVPLEAIIPLKLLHNDNLNCGFTQACPELKEWLRITVLIGGALSLLVIWGHRKVMANLRVEKTGKERYWLILTLIILNIGFLILSAFGDNFHPAYEMGLIRTIIGLAFIYLVTTTLFRIYPQALILQQTRLKTYSLTKEDMLLAEKITKLLTLDKVYHEPTYSRADLAKEIEASEASVSRVINVHFKKSLPQLLNEQRVQDAKRLLLETDANIKTVAQEVGFNSIPSFNRVFKELEGCNPSDYRKNMIK